MSPGSQPRGSPSGRSEGVGLAATEKELRDLVSPLSRSIVLAVMVLLATARAEQAVCEDMAALRVDAELGLVDCREGEEGKFEKYFSPEPGAGD